MKGITPVIAIILLLLMAVAAAGGFYFVYQGFTEEGEESGSTQIESLGEQSLAALQIESAAGGRLYVKNVGAGEVDLSSVSIYVENVPYNVNRSSDTLAERSRAVLKFTQAPACAGGSCEVKISGAASASRTFDSSKLVCSSNAECYSGESCEGGVCVEEEEEEAFCGDGECDEGEHGYDCWEDCRPESVALTGISEFYGYAWLAQYDWNGTTYDFVENVTGTGPLSLFQWVRPLFLANGKHITVGASINGDWRSCFHSKYDGSSWSYPSNISNQHHLEDFPWADVDSSGNAMFVWPTGLNQPHPNRKLQWAALQDNVVSDPADLTGWLHTQIASFAFAPDNSGFAVYLNTSNFGDVGQNYNHKVLYSHWDGSSWDDQGVVANYPNVLNAHMFNLHFPLVSFEENGDALAVWTINNKTNYKFIKYSAWDGSSWTYQGNFEGWTPAVVSIPMAFGLKHDHQGNAVLLAATAPDDMEGEYYFTYDGTWSENQTIPGSVGKTFPALSKMQDNTLVAWDIDFEAVSAKERAQWRWMAWNGDGWSDPVYVGPFGVA